MILFIPVWFIYFYTGTVGIFVLILGSIFKNLLSHLIPEQLRKLMHTYYSISKNKKINIIGISRIDNIRQLYDGIFNKTRNLLKKNSNLINIEYLDGSIEYSTYRILRSKK